MFFQKKKKVGGRKGTNTYFHVCITAVEERRGGLPDTRDGGCHPPSPRAGGEPPDPRGPARCFRKLKCVHVSQLPGAGGAAPAREECVCCLL